MSATDIPLVTPYELNKILTRENADLRAREKIAKQANDQMRTELEKVREQLAHVIETAEEEAEARERKINELVDMAHAERKNAEAAEARVRELQGECDRLAKREAELTFEAGKYEARLRAVVGDRHTDAHFNVETMLADCVPGGHECDPQRVADDIRAWFSKRDLPPHTEETDAEFARQVQEFTNPPHPDSMKLAMLVKAAQAVVDWSPEPPEDWPFAKRAEFNADLAALGAAIHAARAQAGKEWA